MISERKGENVFDTTAPEEENPPNKVYVIKSATLRR